MRILCVIDSLAWGGSQRQMANLAAGLKRRGHDAQLFVYYPEFDHYAALVRAAGVPVEAYRKRIGFDPGVVWRLARLMRQRRFDVVLSFLTSPSNYALLASRFAGRVPVVVSERGSFRPGPLGFWNRWLRLPHRLAAHVTTNAHHHRERMEREFRRTRGRITTIWNGIDTDLFRPRATSGASHGATGPLRLLAVGTVVPIKDVEILARALVALARRGGPPVEVSWAGQILETPSSRDTVDRVDRLLAEHGVAGRWRWLGLCSDVAALYHEHGALVHPSVREGLPNAVCEALASGLPVIAGRGADHARLLGEGERGLLFEPGDPERLADAIATFAALSPAERAAMGARARAFAEKSLSLEAFLDQYEALLQRVAGKRPG